MPVDPTIFYGRQQDGETLIANITAFPGDSYALIGGRRMGKTSLLEALFRLLDNPEISEKICVTPIFLDLTGEGIQSTFQFFQIVGTQIHDKMNFALKDVPEPFTLAGTQAPAPVMQRILPIWERAVIQQLGRRLRVILLLDECEQIADCDWASDLYSSLRYLLVGMTTRSLLKVVMVGSHGFLSKVRQQGSPLRNILKYHMLKVLDAQATYQLVTEPTEGVLPAEVVQTVIAQSGGHAFMTQYLMHHLWEAGLEKASPTSVDKLAANFHHERNDFRDWMNGLGVSGARVYQVLVNSENPLTESEIRSQLSPSPHDFVQSLDALCYHGLVVQDKENYYQVTGHMFKKWFEENVVIQTADAPGDVQQPGQSMEPGNTIQMIVEGDYVDQRGQQIHGAQTNIAGVVDGAVLSGDFDDEVSVKN